VQTRLCSHVAYSGVFSVSVAHAALSGANFAANLSNVAAPAVSLGEVQVYN